MAGRLAVDQGGAKTAFDDLDADAGTLDLLLGQVGAHHPAGLAVAFGHRGGGELQFGKAERAIQKTGQRRLQRLFTQQGIAEQFELGDSHGQTGLRFHLGGRHRRVGADQALWRGLAVTLDLLQERAGVRDGLGLCHGVDDHEGECTQKPGR